MVTSAKNPPEHYKEVLLIMGPSPYSEMIVGYYDAQNECWRQKVAEQTRDGAFIEESVDFYVAGWTDLPDIELWKDQLMGEYEWEREHDDNY